MDLADRFLRVEECLECGLWGLGPQRHIIGDRFLSPAWYASYAKAVGLPVKPTEAAREA